MSDFWREFSEAEEFPVVVLMLAGLLALGVALGLVS